MLVGEAGSAVAEISNVGESGMNLLAGHVVEKPRFHDGGSGTLSGERWPLLAHSWPCVLLSWIIAVLRQSTEIQFSLSCTSGKKIFLFWRMILKSPAYGALRNFRKLSGRTTTNIASNQCLYICRRGVLSGWSCSYMVHGCLELRCKSFAGSWCVVEIRADGISGHP